MIRLGFIGTGHLTGFLVDGLIRAKAPYAITVSPRGASKAAELKQKHGIAVAPDNQAVVDGSDIVIVAVLPQDGIQVMSGLRFREGQIVISTMAALMMAAVSGACRPATPGTSSAVHPYLARPGPSAVRYP